MTAEGNMSVTVTTPRNHDQCYKLKKKKDLQQVVLAVHVNSTLSQISEAKIKFSITVETSSPGLLSFLSVLTQSFSVINYQPLSCPPSVLP